MNLGQKEARTMKNDKFIKFFKGTSWLFFILDIVIFVWNILSGKSTDQYWYVFFIITILWFVSLFCLATFADEQ